MTCSSERVNDNDETRMIRYHARPQSTTTTHQYCSHWSRVSVCRCPSVVRCALKPEHAPSTTHIVDIIDSSAALQGLLRAQSTKVSRHVKWARKWSRQSTMARSMFGGGGVLLRRPRYLVLKMYINKSLHARQEW